MTIWTFHKAQCCQKYIKTYLEVVGEILRKPYEDSLMSLCKTLEFSLDDSLSTGESFQITKTPYFCPEKHLIQMLHC